MLDEAKFIWLDSYVYPELQKSPVSVFMADYNDFGFDISVYKRNCILK